MGSCPLCPPVSNTPVGKDDEGATFLGKFLFSLTDISVVVSLKVSELKKSFPLLKLGDIEDRAMSGKY